MVSHPEGRSMLYLHPLWEMSTLRAHVFRALYNMHVKIIADIFIFVTTMGASSEKATQALAEGIESNPAWAGLTAVKEGRYILLPKELFHNKPNHRWGESYEILADYLYAEEAA